MKEHPILEKPSSARRDEFLGGCGSEPQTSPALGASTEDCRGIQSEPQTVAKRIAHWLLGLH